MDNLLLFRIESLIDHIDLVLRDTKDLSLEEIEKSSLLLRATCFSVVQIGEMMAQLQKDLSRKYDRLPWGGAKGMRNTIVHDYGERDMEQIYSTIRNDLPALRKAFVAIKNDIVFDTLGTERLSLRKIKKDDAESIYRNWASDPEVTKYVTWPTHQSIEDTKKIMSVWLKEYENPKTVRFGIVLKKTNELIGMIDVVDYVNGVPEIGYCLSRKYWNHGYMSEACNRFVNYLFDICYKEVVIEAIDQNIGSNRVIEKCGFTFTHKESKPCSIFKPETVTVNWYKKTNISQDF